MARVLTESWAASNMYCPRCGEAPIKHFPNNQKVADFYCPFCKNQYELKSKGGIIGRKIADGAYGAFIQRIRSDTSPDFIVLSYDPIDLWVENCWVIPKHFFTPLIVEKRSPLPPTARRAGWIGCNILFEKIPEQGKIAVVQNRMTVDKKIVTDKMQRASLLQTSNLESRGWLFDVLNCINCLENDVFTLTEMYQNESVFKMLHPQNRNIRPKIRQQLQFLRDKGYVEFVGRGLYKRIR
ncbi:MAG: restriction endonuclease [Oscillibacter sp.]|nr:restriction endonuclease [Oscillibacter sp.]